MVIKYFDYAVFGKVNVVAIIKRLCELLQTLKCALCTIVTMTYNMRSCVPVRVPKMLTGDQKNGNAWCQHNVSHILYEVEDFLFLLLVIRLGSCRKILKQTNSLSCRSTQILEGVEKSLNRC